MFSSCNKALLDSVSGQPVKRKLRDRDGRLAFLASNLNIKGRTNDINAMLMMMMMMMAL